jgi:hypothetical protein
LEPDDPDRHIEVKTYGAKIKPYMMKLFQVALLAALGVSLSCSPKYADPQLNGPIGIVHFPDGWMKMVGNERRGVNDNIHYVVRKSARGELLFAVKQGFTGAEFGKEFTDFPVESPDYDYYSDNQYAVSLDGAYRVRNASPQEWTTATKVVHSYHIIRSYENPQVTKEGVQYKGRLYRKSGESWGNEVALVSPRETWITVFSWSSRDKPDPGLLPGFPGGGGEPGRGEVFLDVYNVSSGEKAISARSPYGSKPGGFAPSMLFSGSLWIEDRYLIVPLNWWLEDCFVGVLPEK